MRDRRIRRLIAAGVAIFLARSGALLAANLAFLNFLEPTLPGVFASNPWHEVNGALWTLKIEGMFYALVPLIVLAYRRMGSALVLGYLYLLSVLYSAALQMAMESSDRVLWAQLQRQLHGQPTYFLAGAALYLYRDSRRWGLLLAAGAALYLVQYLTGDSLACAALLPAWMGIAVVFAACGLPYLGNFARFGDLSYGVYIIHFPVIQVAVANGYFIHHPWAALAATSAITIALALLCWHLVEKPFLGSRSHYRLVERAPQSMPLAAP